MEGVQSQIGYYPKCPHCLEANGFNTTLDPHTVGASGMYELVSCKSCQTLIHISCPPNQIVSN